MTTKLIVLAGFIFAFFAGWMVGIERRTEATATIAPAPTTRPGGANFGRRGGDPGIVARELDLSREQSAQMREIWSEVASRGGREQEERRRQLRQQREEAVVALVPPADREQYAKVQNDYTARVAALDQEWRDAYDAAVKKTKEILTPEQRRRYEAILNRNQWDRGGRGRGSQGGGRDGRDGREQRQDRDERQERVDRQDRQDRQPTSRPNLPASTQQ